jgi:hypothetical protein
MRGNSAPAAASFGMGARICRSTGRLCWGNCKRALPGIIVKDDRRKRPRGSNNIKLDARMQPSGSMRPIFQFAKPGTIGKFCSVRRRSELFPLILMPPDIPAGVLPSLRKQRHDAGHVHGPHIVVLRQPALQRNFQELAHRYRRMRRATQLEYRKIYNERRQRDYCNRQQHPQSPPPKPAHHLSTFHFRSEYTRTP